jgi:sec-independent protein translocase protein TatA
MSLGFGEIALILVVVLIVFGAGKLPHVMGDLGKGFSAFKRGIKDADAEKTDDKSAN